MKPSITIGSDPELHMVDLNTGSVVSTIRVFPMNDKHNPIDLKDGIKMYPDNVLLETSFPPATSVNEMIVIMREVFYRMQLHIGPRFMLLPVAAQNYPKKELRGKRAWQVGCNPSTDAYTIQTRPVVPFNGPMRTGSFHIHIGHSAIEGNNCASEKAKIIKLMDIFVGCASVLFDKDTTGPMRRSLYGKAGDYRPTPYGCEYRVLGNWALSSPITTELVFDLTMYMLSLYDQGVADELLEAVGPVRPQRAINDNKRGIAEECLEICGTPYALMDRIKKDYGMPTFNDAWGI